MIGMGFTGGVRTRNAEARIAAAGNYRPWPYWLGTIGWIIYFVLPIVPGWLIGRVFDSAQALPETGGSYRALIGWVAAFVAAQTATVIWIIFAHREYMQGIEASKGLMRANVLANQLASRRRPPQRYPVGDVVARLRDDPFDSMMLLDNWTDLVGSTVLTMGSFVLLAEIDAWAALAGVVPLLLIGLANAPIASVARRYRAESRRRESRVGDFLTAAFEGSLSVKVAGAGGGVLSEIGRRNAARSRSKVKDEVWNDAHFSINVALVDVAIGFGLLVAVRGPLSAGDIALFAVLLTNVQWLPLRIGGVMVGRKRSAVSLARLDAVATPTDPDPETDYLTQHRPLPVLGGSAVPAPTGPDRIALQRLDVEAVSLAERNVATVSMTVRANTLTVITGRVGSGKTSLVQGLIGYLDFDSGSVRWNGEPIDEPARFMVPPQCAFIAQVPRLFAESLRDNLRLGYAIGDDELAEAIELAAFGPDVAGFGEGLETLVGTRGVRLSGGQVQRAATARALAHRPELLIFDDISSALDVETELALWDGLASAGYTVIAVSNRPVVIARADQVISLDPADDASQWVDAGTRDDAGPGDAAGEARDAGGRAV